MDGGLREERSVETVSLDILRRDSVSDESISREGDEETAVVLRLEVGGCFNGSNFLL